MNVWQLLSTIDAAERHATKDFWRDLMRREISVLMAGPFAELTLCGAANCKLGAYYNLVVFGCECGDMVEAQNVMTDYKALSGREPWRKIANAALDLVRLHWPAIQAVANALLDRHQLSHDEVIEIVGPTLKAAAA